MEHYFSWLNIVIFLHYLLGQYYKWQSFPGEESIPYRCIASDSDTFASANLRKFSGKTKLKCKFRRWNSGIEQWGMHIFLAAFSVSVWSPLGPPSKRSTCPAKGHSQPLLACRTLWTALLHSNYSYLSTSSFYALTACIALHLTAKHKIKALQFCMPHVHTRRKSPCLEKPAE